MLQPLGGVGGSRKVIYGGAAIDLSSAVYQRGTSFNSPDHGPLPHLLDPGPLVHLLDPGPSPGPWSSAPSQRPPKKDPFKKEKMRKIQILDSFHLIFLHTLPFNLLRHVCVCVCVYLSVSSQPLQSLSTSFSLHSFSSCLLWNSSSIITTLHFSYKF